MAKKKAIKKKPAKKKSAKKTLEKDPSYAIVFSPVEKCDEDTTKDEMKPFYEDAFKCDPSAECCDGPCAPAKAEESASIVKYCIAGVIILVIAGLLYHLL